MMDSALIEWTSPQTGVQLYEVRYGDFVRDPGQDGRMSRWQIATDGDYPAGWERAAMAVMNVTDDYPSYVGHYSGIDGVRHFITFYMRGSIVSEVGT